MYICKYVSIHIHCYFISSYVNTLYDLQKQCPFDFNPHHAIRRPDLRLLLGHTGAHGGIEAQDVKAHGSFVHASASGRCLSFVVTYGVFD